MSEKAASDLVSQLINNKTTSNILDVAIAGGNLADMGPLFIVIADALNTATIFENQRNIPLTFLNPYLNLLCSLA